MELEDLNFEALASNALRHKLRASEVMDRMEKALATIALMRHSGHLQKAANELGIHRNTLARIMHAHNLHRKVFLP